MEPTEVPHFHNEFGVDRIRVGVRKFMCIGALPPFDHPHVFLDMGEEDMAICPYCSTQFFFDASLHSDCDPRECAYVAERQAELTGLEEREREAPTHRSVAPPAPPAVAAPAIEISRCADGVLASFSDEAAMEASLHELEAAGLDLETFSPTVSGRDPGQSILPKLILVGGMLGALGGFAMQSYANILGYPLDIGGRPEFSWPSFAPIAFEIGVLCAVLTAFFGCLIAAGLFKLYDPIDEHRSISRALRDRWVVFVSAPDRDPQDRAAEILRSSNASRGEEAKR